MNFAFFSRRIWYEYCRLVCLTENSKKSILLLRNKDMTHKKGPVLLFLFCSVLITCCSRPQIQTQLHFGILAAQKDLWDEAIFRWKKVLQADPDSAAAHNNLAVAYEKKGLWEEAEREYEAALKLKPNHEFITANYEKFKSRLEDAEDSEKDEKNADKKKDKKKK
jgi:tetratricopeptide (TPR) repeat protein